MPPETQFFSESSSFQHLEAGASYDVLKSHPNCWPLGRFGDILQSGDVFHVAMERSRYISLYGFVILAEEALNQLAGVLTSMRVLDAGAGGGYLAHELGSRGVAVTAVDNLSALPEEEVRVWKRDLVGDALPLLPGDFDAVLLVWPNIHAPFAHDVARAMRPGQVLVYQGEGPGGCTADDGFFEYMSSGAFSVDEPATLSLRKFHLNFTGIHDRWTVFRKLS